MQLSSQVQPYVAILFLLLSNVVFYLPRQVSKFLLHKYIRFSDQNTIRIMLKKELIFHSNVFIFLYQMSVKKLNFVAKAKPLKFRKLWAANCCQVSDFDTAVLLSNKRSHNVLVKVLFTSVVVKATVNASFEFARNLFQSSFFIR